MRKNPMNRAVLSLALLSGVALAGCASTESVTQTAATKERAEALSQIAAKPMAAADVSPIRIKDAVYVGATVSRNEHGEPLPSKWERGGFTVARARLASFQEVAAAITEQTGLPVAVTGMTLGGGGPGRPSAPVAPPVANSGLPSNVLSAIQGGGAQQQASIQAVQALDAPSGDLGITGRMQVRYSGSLPGFLDLVASNFNVSWEHREGKIVFHRYITRSFEVPALPVASDLSFKLTSGSEAAQSSGGAAGGGSSSGGSGGASQTATTKSAFDLWKDLETTLQAVIGREGGQIQVSSQQGSVTVTGSPSTVRRVQEYLKAVNTQLAKQVAINVKVYSVALNDDDNWSSDVAALIQDRSPTGAVRSALSIGGGAGGSSPSAALGVLQSGSREGVGWAILDGGRYSGSNGLFNALSSRGDVSVVTSASATALNGQPVPIQVANTRGYAAKVSVVQGSGLSTGTQTSIEPGSVTTGFNLHLVPRIQKDGNLMLQYGLNVSELVGAQNGFDVFSTGGNSIQLPNINQRNFIQQAILPNNSTLVLAGFEQVRSTSVKSGQGHSALWALGGRSNSTMRREILVVAITPTVLDVNAAASNVAVSSVRP